MRVIQVQEDPVDVLTYYRVREGSKGKETLDVPFYAVHTDSLPHGISALIATSDLQGVEALSRPKGRIKPGHRLVGHAVAEKCSKILDSLGLDSGRAGVFLAGDLHSDVTLSKRGGYGDVRDIWMAFRERFRWCVGVAGNHDTFGGVADLEAFKRVTGIHLLDGNLITVNGLRIGGVSGVIGTSTSKPWRQPPDAYKRLVDQALRASPRLFLLHEGPSIREKGLDGRDETRGYIEAWPPCIVICGHRNWPGNRMEMLSNGGQVLNVEGKVVLFIKTGCLHRR